MALVFTHHFSYAGVEEYGPCQSPNGWAMRPFASYLFLESTLLKWFSNVVPQGLPFKSDHPESAFML